MNETIPTILTTPADVDLITAILTRDWISVGTWSLLLSTWISVLLGAVREWWVPGRRYRRLEESSKALTQANAELLKQNGQLITANEITKHFFEETVPKKGGGKDGT